MIKNVKNTMSQTYLTKDLNGEEIVRMFYEKKLQKTNQTEFKIEKLIKRVMNCMLNGKVMVICLIAEKTKKTQYRYFT